MAKTVASRKAKGRRLQQDVAHAIRSLFDLPEEDVKSSTMGETGRDVQLSARASECFPYSVECKNSERFQVWKSIEQAEANADDGHNPVVIFKRNRSKPYCIIDFDQFMMLCRKAYDYDSNVS